MNRPSSSGSTSPSPSFTRILVSRTDRAGDLVLTLPVFRELRAAFPQARLVAHVRPYTAPLLRGLPGLDGVLIDPVPPGLRGIRELTQRFRRERPDLAILVHPAPRVVLAAWLAGIPVRLGRASNVAQVFLTHRMVQNRSRNERHEYEYNLDLLTGLGLQPAPDPPRLALRPEAAPEARRRLDALDASFQPGRFVVVHPGHGGSAYNLSLERYIRLIRSLRERGLPVLATCGPGETGLARRLRDDPEGPVCPVIDDAPDLEALAALLATAGAFVGGSTGPLHIAAAAGVPVVAFFPPVRAMTPRRWGPVGGPALVLQPSRDTCEGVCKACPDRGCMDRIDLAPALHWLVSFFH